MKIAPADPEKYDAMLALVLGRLPHMHPEMIQPLFHDPVFATDRRYFAATDGDRLLGIAMTAALAPFPPDWRTARVVVEASAEGQGVGRALHAALVDGLDDELVLRSGVHDSEERSLAVAKHWGFGVLQHSISSELHLPAPPSRPVPDDVTFEHTSTLEFDDEGAVDAMLVASQTNPEAASFLMDRAVLLGFMADGENPLGVVLRVDGRPAAICWGSSMGEKAHIAYTGVDPAYRGRGLGYLVKQEMHQLAYDAGALRCGTDNEEHNAGIRHVNEALGYTKVSGSYWLQKPL